VYIVFTFQSLLLRGLGRAKITLKHVSVSAILTLALRPLVSAGFSEKLMTMFLIHILSVPALVLHIQSFAPEVRKENFSDAFSVLGMDVVSFMQVTTNFDRN